MSETVHTETESKHDASAELAITPRADEWGVDSVHGPVETELVAAYYDTDDLALARAGITLRRRVGGDDHGWHLKLPKTLRTRIELRRPLGRSLRVPRPFAELLTATVRGERLDAVATIRTHRTSYRLAHGDGTVLAEVADDRVEGELRESEVSVWREIEVELVDGDDTLLQRLEKTLADLGATPSDAPSKLSRLLGDKIAVTAPERSETSGANPGSAGALLLDHLGEHRDELVALDPLVRRDESRSVHKMRVATRRLRSALATYRRLLDRSVTDPLRDELKWLAGELGAVRDADVIGSRIEAQLDKQPRDVVIGPVRRRLGRTLGSDRNDARVRLLTALASERYVKLLDALDVVVAGHALQGERTAKPARSIRTEVRREHRRWRRHVKRYRSLDDAGVASAQIDLALHDVRKASKRVRYAADSARPIASKKAKRLADDMECIQETLGEHQDTVVTRSVMRRLAATAHDDGEDTLTWGRLHADEQGRAIKSVRRSQRLIDDSWSTPRWLDSP